MNSPSTSQSIPDITGVTAALTHARKDQDPGKFRTILDEFRLDGRVGLVTGANGGIGLESALALAELGAKVWALDLNDSPSAEFEASAVYAKAVYQETAVKLGEDPNKERLVYRRVDVTDENAVQEVCQEIVATDGSLDICVAAAGILPVEKRCIDVTSEEFQKVMSVNSTGVFNTATKAAAAMAALGIPGSIILIASMSGSITNRDHAWIAYNASKSAVLQIARSMACELGAQRIRVNTLSPGHIRTAMTAQYLDKNPELEGKWSSMNPLGRIGSPHELRGVISWLASDASTFCTGSDIIVSGGHHAW
ncbi:hypothetical protein MJO28_009203 [Puccinia striiformis f. sp. tritici]|uniref:Uncharacterized protein n=1 Tax=Puccinia striiformis f. sp. tritici TaxID=168172 RepID=A0ACC0E6F2_9BASI|nr:hypothetical protein Pst134EA_017865 [Puccinia striiformis f. sp. tritici]KAH9461566.1 hypothetical protein Pst134EA_017865 [Puccinia striiformis f. sp. tritici]KAI7947295.1 hypothetical protein MJO28_009203 [Puccinia striiformis f. sp. tritici]KAI7950384.1 hypothetical protein MJO29_009058 [Puccinia striiformis f. sp. tritici]